MYSVRRSRDSYVFLCSSYIPSGEVRGGAPTVRKAGHIAVGVVSTLFFLVNVAYVAAIPKDEIENGGQLVAAHFFARVFGAGHAASKILPAMIACSCAGNLVRPFLFLLHKTEVSLVAVNRLQSYV